MGFGLREILLEAASSSFPNPQRAKNSVLGTYFPAEVVLRAAGNPHLLSDQGGQAWLGVPGSKAHRPAQPGRSSD
jgi:hypothetical protein